MRKSTNNFITKALHGLLKRNGDSLGLYIVAIGFRVDKTAGHWTETNQPTNFALLRHLTSLDQPSA